LRALVLQRVEMLKRHWWLKINVFVYNNVVWFWFIYKIAIQPDGINSSLHYWSKKS
jgi:hypothetical protein